MVYVDILSCKDLGSKRQLLFSSRHSITLVNKPVFFSPYAGAVHQVSLRAGHMMFSVSLSIQYYHRSFRVLPVGLIRSMPWPLNADLLCYNTVPCRALSGPPDELFGTFCFQNDLTGEHSCIMLRRLSDEEQSSEENWLQAYWTGEVSPFTGGRGDFLKFAQRKTVCCGRSTKTTE